MASFTTKDDIKRQQLKNHFLKRIIIRFDFTTIVNLQEVLNQIVPLILAPSRLFGSFDQVSEVKNEMYDNNRAKEKEDIDRPVIYRFSDCLIKPIQNVSLDLARDFLCLDIRCDEKYTVIDPYLELMTEIASAIFKIDFFVQLRRVGIRKINGVDEIDPKDADSIFEYFSQSLSWRERDEMIQRQYTDNMLCHSLPAYLIYSRIVRRVPGSTNLRFTLDMDCYKDETFLEKRPEKCWIGSVLTAMNDKLFDLFKMGIKLEYFNQNL